jgi:lipopolysaccharide export system permease protein
LDTVELLRRAVSKDAVGFATLLKMAALKLPFVSEKVLPFGVLFASIYTCWKLNRTQELVVIRAAGLSAWQFLAPLLLSAFALGFFATAVLSPFSSFLFGRYNQMENIHFKENSNLVTVSRSGIWLRQATDDGYALLRAAAFDEHSWQFSDLTLLFFDRDDGYIRRLDAKTGYLQTGAWDLRRVTINDGAATTRQDAFTLPTTLTASKIEESFADPETLSFWRMPEYLGIMEESGIPTTRLRIYYQSLLAKPFLLIGMVLLAATFSLRPTRFGGTSMLIALGAAAGFFIFFFESMLHAFGFSQKIPVLLSAWTPSLVGIMIGASALLHLEDG